MEFLNKDLKVKNDHHLRRSFCKHNWSNQSNWNINSREKKTIQIELISIFESHSIPNFLPVFSWWFELLNNSNKRIVNFDLRYNIFVSMFFVK